MSKIVRFLTQKGIVQLKKKLKKKVEEKGGGVVYIAGKTKGRQ